MFRSLLFRPGFALPLLATLAALSGSCRSLDRFDTKGDPAFCGDIVLGPAFTEGFIQEKQDPPLLSLMLELDTSQIANLGEVKASFPGLLSSNEVGGLCPGEPLFKSAQLRTVPQVYHDTLSTLSFGEGHDEDFFVWVDSTCQGTMLGLVSLLRNGHVELRLFKPAPLSAAAAPPPDQSPGYALFYLNRSEHGCEGF